MPSFSGIWPWILNPPDSSPAIIGLYFRIAAPTCLNPTGVSTTSTPSFWATISSIKLAPTVFTKQPEYFLFVFKCINKIAIISFGVTYSPFSFTTPNLSESPSFAKPT